MGVNLPLPQTVRSIGRLQTIAAVLTHHGFGHLLDALRLERYIPLPKRWQRPSTPADESTIGQRLVRVCEDLGPSFIKLGQVLSTRPDLVPTEIADAMASLQDNVPPFKSETARQMVAKDLGAPIDELFASFDAEPLASGSIAQVHRASTRATESAPSRRVVVKVRRPDIEDTIRLDMNILRWIADLAERFAPDAGLYQPQLVVEEFERTLMRELDFINEAATIERFRTRLGDGTGLKVPEVFWELTGPNVLAIEELEGVKMQAVLKKNDDRFDHPTIARTLATGYMKQFFEMGLFHADPHPGNFFVTAPASVGMIDFGLTGQLDDEMMGHLVIALTGAISRQPDVVVEVLADMNALSDETDRTRFRRDLMQLIDKYYGLPLFRFNLQTLFHEFTDLVRQNRVSLPREFVLFGKALVGVGGMCLQLDPKLDLLALVKPKIRRLLRQRFEPRRLMRTATISGWHLWNILRTAPGQLRDVSRRLARGQWQLNVHHQNLDDLGHELDRSSNRLVVAIITASVILGSSWVLTSDTTLAFLNIPLTWIGVVGYLFAGVLGLWLVLAILRSGKLS